MRRILIAAVWLGLAALWFGPVEDWLISLNPEDHEWIDDVPSR